MNLKEYSDKKADLRQQIKALWELVELKQLFADALKEVFDAHPVLAFVQWVQYTPYFNDGDPCTFSVGELEINESDYRRYEYEGEWKNPFAAEPAATREELLGAGVSSWRVDAYLDKEHSLAYIHALEAAKQAVYDVWHQVDEDDLLAMFEDHTMICITRDGLTVREHNHD